jgi:hypothetical protein
MAVAALVGIGHHRPTAVSSVICIDAKKPINPWVPLPGDFVLDISVDPLFPDRPVFGHDGAG